MRSGISAGRTTQWLFVNWRTSPDTGPANAIATALGNGVVLSAAKACQAVWKLACSAVFKVVGAPSDLTRPSSTIAMAKRAWVPPMSTDTTSHRSEEQTSELQ